METKKTWRSVEIPYYSQWAIRRSVKFRMFLIDHYIKFGIPAPFITERWILFTLRFFATNKKQRRSTKPWMNWFGVETFKI